MSCYLRHMRPLFDALGLEYDRTNRARVDAAVRDVLRMTAADGCPAVWAAVKALPDEDREDLPARIAERIGGG